MLRNSLKQGDIVCLNGKEIIVDSIIGYGATCIVYSAHYYDDYQNCYRVNLKECYPYIADVRRVDGELIWGAEKLKCRYQEKFIKSYKKVMKIQDIARNTTVNPIGIGEYRGTLYSAMSVLKGETFDKVKCSLTDALKITCSLTKTVRKYHQNGYLHLDIKPTNFLTISESSEIVIVFDMDTVTAIDSLKNSEAGGCSYTDGWSAPEQRQGMVSKLCPATDIFAIGAVLFEKIMGKLPEARDMVLSAEWDFEGELFDKVNPKIKRLLTDIFRKTISAAIKRRYQSADELIEALDEAIKVSEQTMYLVSNCPISTTRFVGRDDDIRLIDKALEDGKVVFLNGEGGIGKSTLAIEYASRRKKIFDAVIFLRYQNTLEALLDSITIENFEGDSDQKQKRLRSLLNKNILLIIDNFDVAVDEESEYLEKVLSYNCRLIFTTRTNFDIYQGKVMQIEVGRLSDFESVEVFENASDTEVDDEDYKRLLEMFAFVGFNTFVVELLGRQVYSCGYTVTELYDRLVKGVDTLSKSAKVKALKDGKVIKEKVPQIIRVLFDMSKLSDEKLNALRNLYLLGFLNLDAKTYRKFTNAEDESCTDTLNDLVDLGWVRKSGALYSLHPLIEELVKTDLKPCRENCESIYKTIDEYVKDCVDYTDDLLNFVNEVIYKDKCRWLIMLFLRLDIKDEANLKIVLLWLLGIIKNGLIETFGEEIEKLFAMLFSNINYYGDYYTFLVKYIYFENRLLHTHRTVFNSMYDKTFLLVIMADVPGYDDTKNALYKLKIPKREKAIQMLSEYGLSGEAEYWLSREFKTGNDDVIREPVKNDFSWTVKIEQIRNELKNSDDLSFAINQVLNDCSLHLYQKVAILIEHCENNLSVFYSQMDKKEIQRLARTIDCKAYKLLIDAVDSLMESSEWKREYYGYDISDNTLVFSEKFGYREPVCTSIKYIQVYIFVLAVIESDYSKFCSLIDRYNQKAEGTYRDILSIFRTFLDVLIPLCRNFEKSYYLLQYLFDALVTLENDIGSGYRVSYEKTYNLFIECVNESIEQANNGLCEDRNEVIALASRTAENLISRYNYWKGEFEKFDRNISDVLGSPKADVCSLYSDYFYYAEDKYDVFNKIVSDSVLSDYYKAMYVNRFMDQIVYRYIKYGSTNTYYDQIKKILDEEYSLLCSDKLKEFGEDRYGFTKEWIINNIINQVILAASTQNAERVEYYIGLLNNISDIYHLVDLLDDINLSSWVLPSLINMSEFSSKMSVREYVGIYERIASCAKNARNETDIPAEYQLDYDKIIVEYQKRIDELMGKDFSFKLTE